MNNNQVRDENLKDYKTFESYTGGIVPWFKNAIPHEDIRKGHLDESVFAANIAEVDQGIGRDIYQDPDLFLSKTYYTAGINTIVKRVIQGLNGQQDAENRVITLQTGFGGGKTHALITLYHVIKMGKEAVDFPHTRNLITENCIPQFEKTQIAVFTNRTNDPTQGRIENGIHIRTLWGELAFRLGGLEAYRIIEANDQNYASPKGLFQKVLEITRPCLILIDELADYCMVASGIRVGNSTLCDQTISFIQELSEAVSGTDRCVLVATLPASVTEVATSANAVQILTSLSNRLSRVGADTKPISDVEITQVIRRRLFENKGSDDIIEKAVSLYMKMYEDHQGEIPSAITRSEYKQKLMQCYPFHPELIDILRSGWASHHDFQRTRGVLRLLAAITSNLWDRQGSLTGTNAFIHTSDVDFQNIDALSSQLKKLWGNGYDAVISADVSGSSSNAFKIDSQYREYGVNSLTQGIASTILLASFGNVGHNKGISIEEIKLCVMKPYSFNHNSINTALDRLEENAHYLYIGSAGNSIRHYWFYTKPNINILLNQAKSDIKMTEIDAEIHSRIGMAIYSSERYRGELCRFNILVNPSEDIPEQKKPTLIILSPDLSVSTESLNTIPPQIREHIKKISTKKGNSERIYRNTLLFLICSETMLSKLRTEIGEFLALKKIIAEYKTQIELVQIEELGRKLNDISYRSERLIAQAYSIIAKHSTKNGIETLIIKEFRDSLKHQVDDNIYHKLVDESWLIEKIGAVTLRNNNLYPTLENPIRIKDIYEAFLRYDGKPIITGKEAVHKTVQHYYDKNEFAFAYGYTRNNYMYTYYESPLPLFDVEDECYWIIDKNDSYLARTNAFSTIKNITLDSKLANTNETIITGSTTAPEPITDEAFVKILKLIAVKGEVELSQYLELYNLFIEPLIMNRVKIKFEITGYSTASHPITETGDLFRKIREAAYQLNFDLKKE